VKSLARLMLALALLGGAAAGLLIPETSEARYPRPGCGECVDGSLSSGTWSCGGTHTNCTECTVCG